MHNHIRIRKPFRPTLPQASGPIFYLTVKFKKTSGKMHYAIIGTWYYENAKPS
jgi:hypothetical protein